MRATAALDVRLLPWRPRQRRISPEALHRDWTSLDGAYDVPSLMIALSLWLVVLVAAPLVVLVLAVLLLSVEVPVAIGIGFVLVLIRFAGVAPWSVVVVDPASGVEHRELYRLLWRAAGRVRDLNADGRVRVRWAWA